MQIAVTAYLFILIWSRVLDSDHSDKDSKLPSDKDSDKSEKQLLKDLTGGLIYLR